MRTVVNIYSLVLILILVLAFIGCQRTVPVGEEDSHASKPASEQEQRFDLLDLPADQGIVPEEYPLTADLTRTRMLVTRDLSNEDTARALHEDVPLEIDSVNSQAFRVQLFTSKVFGKARQAVQVAEEIFDRPVYLDYEVPYFKIRVGSFFDRDQAEDYMMRARAAGYKEAWVVVTNVAVREAAPLYFDEPYPVFNDSLEKQIHPDTLFETEDEPVTDG
ncbi:MAG: hypothetical protein DRP47_06380 [Candidatus Zixiibacteriota bacterium]|nr:MAG: hypothetical protein DRP47_06380 [candidate division Zixibacteria bacterium]